MTDRILVDRPAPHVARVRIHWPEKRNALAVALRHELIAALQAFDADDDVRAIVIAGGEKVFASGADLTEILDASAIDMMLRATERLWAAIGRTGKPMVAAVRGLALGGGFELALHADMIVAGESAKLGLPEVKLGLMPGGGGTQRLLRLVGRQRALQLLLTGDTVTAREAQQLGIVNVVAPDDRADDEAVALAARVAAMPPLAVRQIREVVARGADCSLDTALMLESKALQLLCASQDKREGIEALLHKRTPHFTGR